MVASAMTMTSYISHGHDRVLRSSASQAGRSGLTAAAAPAAGSGTVASCDVNPFCCCIQGMQRLSKEFVIALAESLLLSTGVIVKSKVDVQAGIACSSRAVALSSSCGVRREGPRGHRSCSAIGSNWNIVVEGLHPQQISQQMHV